jgi:diguanylate cyclase (GGDEF)-like protein
MDLSRAVDAIRGADRLARHADELEALVAERTQQLEAEIAMRIATEAKLRQVNDELQRSLSVDGLTGIANRAAFDEMLGAQVAAHSRSGKPLSLIMIDVDRFKAYNDHHGHVMGDEALREVARCLREAVRRSGDLAARYGGEEFAVILPNTFTDGAIGLAERILDLIADAAIPHRHPDVRSRLTVSAGVATIQPSPTTRPQDIVAAADTALYTAKRNGRDQIVTGNALTQAARDAC